MNPLEKQKSSPLQKLIEKDPGRKFDSSKLLEAIDKVLIEHNANFAIIWYRDGDNLHSRGWSNDAEGAVVMQVVESFIQRHQDEILADLTELLQPKTKGLEDDLEAEFGT